jgi:hypothetical protein
MAQNKINMTPTYNKTGDTIAELLADIVSNTATIRDNMKGGGLGAKSKTNFINEVDESVHIADTTNDKLERLALISEKLPNFKGRLHNKLVDDLGVTVATTSLETLVQAVEGIDKHNCESHPDIKEDEYGKYIPLGLKEAFAIPTGYHTGNVRIIAVDDDECENEAHLNIGPTKYTGPLPGDISLVINSSLGVNKIDSAGNYYYDDQNHIEQKPYYGLTEVTIVPPDLQSIADSMEKALVTPGEVLKGSVFVGKDGVDVGTLEFKKYTIQSSDLPAPGSAMKYIEPVEGLVYKDIEIHPIPDHYLDISGGGTEVTGTVNLSGMMGNVTLNMSTPTYVKSVNVTIYNDIYDQLCSI